MTKDALFFQETDSMFQAVLDNIPQMIFWKDKSLAYIDCNRSFSKFVSQDLPSGDADTFVFAGKREQDLPWP